MIAEKLVPDFEIFVEQVKEIKEPTIEKPIVEELIQTLESEHDIPAVEQKVTGDQQKEHDFESYVLDSILDVFYDDVDVSLANLFDTDDLFFSKINAMKFDFSYFCDFFLMVIQFVMIISCICLTLIMYKLNYLI